MKTLRKILNIPIDQDSVRLYLSFGLLSEYISIEDISRAEKFNMLFVKADDAITHLPGLEDREISKEEFKRELNRGHAAIIMYVISGAVLDQEIPDIYFDGKFDGIALHMNMSYLLQSADFGSEILIYGVDGIKLIPNFELGIFEYDDEETSIKLLHKMNNYDTDKGAIDLL